MTLSILTVTKLSHDAWDMCTLCCETFEKMLSCKLDSSYSSDAEDDEPESVALVGPFVLAFAAVAFAVSSTPPELFVGDNGTAGSEGGAVTVGGSGLYTMRSSSFLSELVAADVLAGSGNA